MGRRWDCYSSDSSFFGQVRLNLGAVNVNERMISYMRVVPQFRIFLSCRKLQIQYKIYFRVQRSTWIPKKGAAVLFLRSEGQK
jgi:hypothetical protein